MKKTILTLFAFIFILSVDAQIAPNTYLITFKDKNNCGYSIEKPNQFLTEKAVKRRQIYNIPVTYQDLPVTKAYIDSLKSIGLKIKNVSKWLNTAVVYTVDSTLIKKAEKFSFVIPNKVYTSYKVKTNNSSGMQIKSPKEEKNVLVDLKNLLNSKTKKSISNNEFNYDYGKAKTQVQMINCNYLHNNGYRGKGMTIAILDAGFYKVNEFAVFDSIRSNKQILGVKDFVTKDGEVYKDDSHGLMVLSTIAGNTPGQIIGTAPKANLWLLRTEDEATEYIIEEYNWVSGAEFADSLGVDIIHSSLGYSDFDDKINSHKYSDMNGDVTPVSIAADIAASKGILVVTSAGNEGDDIWHYVSAPADADSILSIGAVDGKGILSYFSSRGPSYDGRTKPDVLAQGSYTAVTGRSGNVELSFGTSFSGPIMAGAIACLWQANPTFNNMEIIDAVKKSSNRYENPDNDYGFGIPDFEKADKYLKKLKTEKDKNK